MTDLTRVCMSLARLSAVSMTSAWLGGSWSESWSSITMLVTREMPAQTQPLKQRHILIVLISVSTWKDLVVCSGGCI